MKYVGWFQPSPWGVIMSASRLDLFWKCPFFLSFSFSHSILLQYCCCQLVILMVFAASPKLKVSRIAIGKSIYGRLLLGIQRQGQTATKRLVGIDFQYQCRLHRFIFAVQSVIPRFLEMLNAILNISLSRCVHVCARCLLVCACACVHACACVYACVGEPPGCQDSSCLKGRLSLFCLQKTGRHFDELIEQSWSDMRFFNLKTGTQIQRVLELIYIYCSSLFEALFVMASIFSSSWQPKQCFTPSPPTSACTVTALWT